MLLSWLICVLILGTWSSLVSSSGLKSSPVCLRGCRLALQEVQFNDTTQAGPFLVRSCRSRLSSISVFLCIQEYCEPNSQTAGLTEYNETCRRRSQSSLPPFDVIANLTEDQIAQARRIQPGETNDGGKPFAGMVLPSSRLFQLAFDTIDISSWEGDLHVRYGFAMLYFWITVIGLGISVKLWSLIQHIRHQQWIPLTGDENGGISPRSRGIEVFHLPSLWIKKYVTIPATFGYRCSQNVKWCTIPSRVQSMTIAAFIVMNLVLCIRDYRVFKGNFYWPEISAQYYRYVSDRTGIISFANFPIIWTFGMRNNVLLWLTGWGFGTYNNFHRWIARISTVEAIVHSIGYTLLVLQEHDGWKTFLIYWTERWWWAGELATIFLVTISFFSVYGLRRNYYEVFLYAHIALSMVVLVTMFWHVEIFRGQYNGPIWACLVVWIIDRLLRVYRMLSFNPRFWNTRAMTTYDPSSNIVRMVIPTSSSFQKSPPGTYYYIYVLNDIRIWENHPFTLAYSSPGNCSPTVSTHSLGNLALPDAIGPADERDSGLETSSAASDESEQLLPSSDVSPAFTFLIRPYDGFTSRLRTAALHHPVKLRVLVEGPYGDTHAFHEYDSVLFVVGGTGIATPLSYLTRLLSEDCRTTFVHIVWAVREHSFLADVVQRDLEGYLDNEKLSVTTFVTQHPEDIGENADPAHPLTTRPWQSKDLNVQSGRPNVHDEVQRAVKSAGHGRLAVIACGPAQMADDTRKAVVDVLDFGHERVEYFEESFKW